LPFGTGFRAVRLSAYSNVCKPRGIPILSNRIGYASESRGGGGYRSNHAPNAASVRSPGDLRLYAAEAIHRLGNVLVEGSVPGGYIGLVICIRKSGVRSK
jgi:hypothetical protein